MAAPYPTNRSVQIGNICIQWSNLEYELAVSIWLLTRVPEEVGKILTANLDIKQRATMAHAVAHEINAPVPLKRAIKQTLDELRSSLINRRNEAVHAVHFTPIDIATSKVELHRGKGGRAPRALKDADLSDLGRLIHQAGLRMTEANAAYAGHLAVQDKIQMDAFETALSILRKISDTSASGDK